MRQQPHLPLHLTIIVPGLLRVDKNVIKAFMDMQAEQGLKHKTRTALELLISRSLVNETPNADYDKIVFDCFAVPYQTECDLPVAAFSAYWQASADQRDEKWFLRADPIHLQPDRDQLIVLGNQHLAITQQEAASICQEINNTYQDMPWRLSALTPTQWLLESEEPINVRTFPLEQVIGLSIKDFLPYGEQAKQWHAILNEWQMLMHTNNVNVARSARGDYTINSVWFWGGGRLPAMHDMRNDIPWKQCCSNESLSLALAKFTQVPASNVPADANQWLKQISTSGHYLLVLDDLKSPEAVRDIHDWWDVVQRWDSTWFGPCVQALKHGQLTSLSLLTNGRTFRLDKRQLKRWWKRTRPLYEHILF